MTGPALRACGGGLAFAEELDRFVRSETPLEDLFDPIEDEDDGSEEDADE